MERENFFILLELPFDPPLEDEARIKAAINTKQQEWARLHNEPKTRSIALNYIELIPEIERVMLENPEARSQEAQKAAKIREHMISSFEAELRLLEGKNYILPREVKEITDKYSPYGIDKDIVTSYIKAPVTDTPPKNSEIYKAAKALDQETVQVIRGHLEVVAQENIYTFLGLTKDTDLEALESAARNKQHTAFHAEEKTGKNSAEQLLAEIAIELFTDEEKKSEYDRFLQINAYPQLNDLIDEENERSGYISPDILLRLVNFGVTTYGESILELEEYIRRYAKAYNIAVNMAAPHITCPNCNKNSPRGTAYCVHCAAPLEGKCPKCGTFFSGGASTCLKCSFPLGSMGKALPYIEQVENSLNDNNWSSAQHGLKYVQQYWPLHPQYDGLKQRADIVEEKYYEILGQIEDDIKDNRFYAAREVVAKAKANNIVIPEDTANVIEDTIAGFSEKVTALKKQKKVTYTSLHNLLAEVSDSLELDRMLSQYPPEPPSRITARPSVGDIAEINWTASESTGNVEYIVIRKENSVSLTAYDGDIIYKGDKNTFEDEHIPPLRNFFYSVYTKRGGSFSEMGAVAAAPVRIVPNLRDFKIIPGDNAAQLSWTPPPHLHSVKIWRKLGGEKPKTAGDGIALETNRLDGFSDMKLKNDITYWYYAVASYRTADGETIDSSGITDSVIPHKLIAPIEQFNVSEIENENDHYLASWQGAPRDEILIFSSESKPTQYLGQVVPTDELLYMYNRLQLDNQTPNNARFRLPLDGGKYIFPIAVSGPFGTMGLPYYLTNVPDVKDISYSIVDSDLFLKFDWSEDYSRSVVVAWRKDDYPQSINQKNTEYIECTKEQYDLDFGVRIHDITEGYYYIKIFTTFLSPEDKVIYSKGEEYFVDNTPAFEFFYDIKYSKLLFTKRCNVTVTIDTNLEFDLPKAIIVGKEGRVPLNINDGTLLFELRKEPNISKTIAYEYKTERLPKNMYMRLFFFDDENYKRLRPLPAKSLLIT